MECRAAGAAAPLSGLAGVMRKRAGAEATVNKGIENFAINF